MIAASSEVEVYVDVIAADAFAVAAIVEVEFVVADEAAEGAAGGGGVGNVVGFEAEFAAVVSLAEVVPWMPKHQRASPPQFPEVYVRPTD